MTFDPFIINITPSEDVISLGLNVRKLPFGMFGFTDTKTRNVQGWYLSLIHLM